MVVKGDNMQEKMQQEADWIDSVKKFVGKRVEIDYTQTNDWAGTQGTRRGWLQEYEGRLILVAKRGSNRFTNLTGGAFDGWHATLTVKTIRQV